MSIINDMAYDLLLDANTINAIVNSNSNYRKIKLNNGRIVWQPAPKLKVLQYWVIDYITREGAAPLPCVTAYERGCSIKENALKHTGCKHMLHLDIRRFFPSIGEKLLREYFVAKPLCNLLTEKDIVLLLKIVTFRGGLVMGAPSSPILANRAMIGIDGAIERICRRYDSTIKYTRYSDDMAISSRHQISQDILAEIENVLDEHNFKLNRRKTRWMGKGDSRRITGVSFTEKGQITLGQKRKKQLKKLLYGFALNNAATEIDARRLLGYINFAKSIDAAYVDKLLVKYSVYGDIPTMKKIKMLLV